MTDGREGGWYRGDCHVHSVCMHGGELTPERLAAEARAAGLDFLAATEHNNADTHGTWGRYGASRSAAGVGGVEWRTSARESAFIRVEVRHPGGSMAALSNPVTLF